MDATMENKMGLPPSYEQSVVHPNPPPLYFGNNPPPPRPTAPVIARTTVITAHSQSQSHPQQGPKKLGPGPTGTTCTTCNKTIVTQVDYVANSRTHIVSAALCVLAGCCCGCFVPYCMRSCKNANHYCPACKAFLGTHVPT